MIFGGICDQFSYATQMVQSKDGQDHRSTHQDEHLHHICIDYCLEAAEYGINTRRDHDEDGARPEINAQKRREDNGPRENGHRDLCQDIGNDGYVG